MVFLIDVSGSMDSPDKLGLVKKAMRMLLHQMGPNDRVAVATYRTTAHLALPSTPCSDRSGILDAIYRLSAHGNTNGAGGIELAYNVAAANYIAGGINRVVLCTDGDFNVGLTEREDLVNLVQSRARGGVFLSVMGFGTGNLKDSSLESLADKGNGHYAYIDSLLEARKVFVDQVGGALVTVAKDVKAQVEFNPRKVQAYRLVGYENRVMDTEDFNDDTKDAGDIGAGHTVTVLYELVLPGEALSAPDVDPLKYQPAATEVPEHGDELMTVKLRYKEPEGLRSRLIEHPVEDSDKAFRHASADFRFAAAVAVFGMVLRESPYRGSATLEHAIRWAEDTLTNESSSYRKEFLELARTALDLR
jgi:Ca-activated chloride channel family protein